MVPASSVSWKRPYQFTSRRSNYYICLWLSPYLDPSPGVVGEEIHWWCYTWLDRVSQKEVQLCRVYFFIHKQDLGNTTNRKHFDFSTFISSSLHVSFPIIPRQGRWSWEWANLMASSFSKQSMQEMKWACYSFTWKVSCVMYVSLSHSNRPLVVYWKTEEVMLSIRLDNRCVRAWSSSAFRTALWKTTLNAWGRTGAGTWSSGSNNDLNCTMLINNLRVLPLGFNYKFIITLCHLHLTGWIWFGLYDYHIWLTNWSIQLYE